jgi:hypothetical protein
LIHQSKKTHQIVAGHQTGIGMEALGAASHFVVEDFVVIEVWISTCPHQLFFMLEMV